MDRDQNPARTPNAKSDDRTRTDQALRFLLRFESALVTASHLGASASTELRNEIVRQATRAVRSQPPVMNWRSRPQALAIVADLAVQIGAQNGALSAGDVQALMAATEQSWLLNPDHALDDLDSPNKDRFTELVDAARPALHRA